MDDAPNFLTSGLIPTEAENSALRASSKYLADPELRDWVATIILRKNGPEYPPEREMAQFVPIINRLRDTARIEEMFTEERRTNPALDAWMREGFVSSYSLQDFAGYAPGTVGGIFYAHLNDNDYPLYLMPWSEPKTQLDFYNLRSGQTHDFEHILTGGGFNYMGELVPYWYRLTNVFKFIKNPELAGELSVLQILGSLRYTVRTMLHYPAAWETCVACIQRGMKVGQESDALFMAKMETVFDLPLEEARRKLGVRGAVDVDTSHAGEIYAGRVLA